MPVGDYLCRISSSAINRSVMRLAGVTDLHTQLRIRPVIRYFKALPSTGRLRVLEVGCGSGINLFEIAKLRDIDGVGYDLNKESIDLGKRVSREAFGDRIQLYHGDAEAVSGDRLYDHLLLIDVLEHLRRPAAVMISLDRLLRVGGTILVSVPTRMYPKVFGKRFHKEVGHVMDGYQLTSLTRNLPPHYRLLESSYNTGFPAALGCFIFYRFVKNIKNKYVRGLCELLLQPFRWLDWKNGERVSSSLFAVYLKTGDAG